MHPNSEQLRQEMENDDNDIDDNDVEQDEFHIVDDQAQSWINTWAEKSSKK